MHVISYKKISEFVHEHANARIPLGVWFRLVQKNEFDSFAMLKQLFQSVDKVGNLFVFNIGGNKYRLIAAIHFNRNKIYIRHILTHTEYDKGDWKNEYSACKTH